MGPYKTELVARGYSTTTVKDRVKLDDTMTRSRVIQEPLTPSAVCNLLDALMEFAEARGVSRYPEATLLHRLRAATQP